MTARLLYTVWWLKVWLQHIYCGHSKAHKWGFYFCICENCGLTMEEAEDHTRHWRFARGAGFAWRGRVFWDAA